MGFLCDTLQLTHRPFAGERGGGRESFANADCACAITLAGAVKHSSIDRRFERLGVGEREWTGRKACSDRLLHLQCATHSDHCCAMMSDEQGDDLR